MAFLIAPSANCISSRSAGPRPMMIAPSIWLRRLSGFSTGPQSNASHTCSTWISFLRAVDFDFRAAGHERAFVDAARQADAAIRLLVLHALGPIESLGRLFQHRPQARVVEMGQPKLERIDARGRRHFVHERLAGERVAGRRQRPIRPVPQRRPRADRLATASAARCTATRSSCRPR